jgi:ATP-binding cassette, subfamily B, bacterial PglK
MVNYLLEIYHLLGKDKKKLPWLIIIFLSSAFLDLIGIGLVGPYIALFTDSGSFDFIYQYIPKLNLLLLNDKQLLLTIMGLSLVVIFFLKSLVTIWINYKIISFSQRQDVLLRSSLMETYQSMPYSNYILRNSAEYIDISQRMVGQYSKGVLMALLRMSSDLIVALSISIFLVFSNGIILISLIAIFAGLTVIYDLSIKNTLRYHGAKANEEAKKMVQGIAEGVSGLKEIRILGVEKYFYTKVYDGAKNFANNQKITLILSVIPRYFLEFILILFLVSFVTLILGSEESINDLLPTISILGVAALRLLPAASNVSSTLAQLRFNRPAVKALYNNIIEFDNIKNQLVNKTGNNHILNEKSFELLSVNNLSFKYPEAKEYSLSDINLTIKKGDSIGLIGSSGSGKTTLVDVLLGLLEPTDGEILYNNKLLSECIDIWRSQVAYIPQQIFITDDTFRRNIALGVSDEFIDEKLLASSIKQAKLEELIVQMKDGLDTVLGEHGVRLSGGERQRIALARAFYHNRNIIVMDEATSALDNDTEKEIIKEIEYLKGLKTVIVIAHRLSTVEYCDCIYRMHNGKVIDYGRPDKILK